VQQAPQWWRLATILVYLEAAQLFYLMRQQQIHSNQPLKASRIEVDVSDY